MVGIMAEAVLRLWTGLDGATVQGRSFVRRATRDVRFIVPICIILICGSFAAAALLQMRMDRGRALAQAGAFERARAVDVARGAAASLDRVARMGAVFAASPQQYRSADLGRAEPSIRDI